MKKLILILCMVLLVLPISFAYNPIGFIDGSFRQSVSGNFNENLDSTNVSNQADSIALSGGKQVPLTADLNGDGKEEIIVLDVSTIRVFNHTQAQGFTIVDNVTYNSQRIKKITHKVKTEYEQQQKEIRERYRK